MILVYLMGGLGNQMFQYAAGKALAHSKGVDFKVYFNEDEYPYIKYFYHLDVFKLKAEFPTKEEYKKFKPLKGITYKIAKKLGLHADGKIVAQVGFKYEESFFDIPDNTYIKGFYQSYKYFQTIKDTIREDFTFAKPATGLNAELLEKIESSNSIAIHFRRGDYVEVKKTNDFHGVCSLEYYQAAVDWICEGVDNPQLYIFSNDIQYVKDNFKSSFPITFVEHNDFKNSHEDLRLMAACKHNIIANSSFSWWAAWLNNNPNKKVVAPGRWFTDESINTNDLFPSDWKKL